MLASSVCELSTKPQTDCDLDSIIKSVRVRAPVAPNPQKPTEIQRNLLFCPETSPHHRSAAARELNRSFRRESRTLFGRKSHIQEQELVSQVRFPRWADATRPVVVCARLELGFRSHLASKSTEEMEKRCRNPRLCLDRSFTRIKGTAAYVRPFSERASVLVRAGRGRDPG
uniref:Uncharacterized protein n=1 Tax=Knipowitschia caucasica TaxID=637954 RepID=A0AAV2LGP9_KNICA